MDIVFFNLNKRVDLFYPSQTSLMFQTAAGGVYGLTAARSATIPVALAIDSGSDAARQSQRSRIVQKRTGDMTHCHVTGKTAVSSKFAWSILEMVSIKLYCVIILIAR